MNHSWLFRFISYFYCFVYPKLNPNYILPFQWNTINQDSSERYANADVVLDADSNEEFSDDEGHVVEPIEVNREILHELKIFVGLLAPISNTYLTVVECLNGLLGNNCIVESEFYKICIKQLKENYRSGLNKFGGCTVIKNKSVIQGNVNLNLI